MNSVSELIGQIHDAQIRGHVRKAVEQGLRVGRRSRTGLVILEKEHNKIVTVVPLTKGQNGTCRNVVADLRRGGYDPDAKPQKRPTTAYTQDRVDALTEIMQTEQEQHDLDTQALPWQDGPKQERVVKFLIAHPDRRFTYKFLALVCQIPYMTVASNVRWLLSRDEHIVKVEATLMWDGTLLPDEQYAFERYEAEQRAANMTHFPVFDVYNGTNWHFDAFGRLVLEDETGREWLAVPRPKMDR